MQPMFNNITAIREGWCISQTIGTDDEGDFRLERIDELEIFEHDEDAWGYVSKKALCEGSRYHIEALRFIRDRNPTEFELIENHVGFIGLANSLSHFLSRV